MPWYAFHGRFSNCAFIREQQQLRSRGVCKLGSTDRWPHKSIDETITAALFVVMTDRAQPDVELALRHACTSCSHAARLLLGTESQDG